MLIDIYSNVRISPKVNNGDDGAMNHNVLMDKTASYSVESVSITMPPMTSNEGEYEPAENAKKASSTWKEIMKAKGRYRHLKSMT